MDDTDPEGVSRAAHIDVPSQSTGDLLRAGGQHVLFPVRVIMNTRPLFERAGFTHSPESRTLIAQRNAPRASILAIAGFAAYRSLRSAPTGMIVVRDRANFAITGAKVDCAIGCARTSDHYLKNT